MRDVPGVTRFPSPQMMSQASSTAWVMWIRDETNKAMMMLDEEITREGDPDDPFNGMAGGVFELPPGRTNSFSLPPPIHTPTVTQGAEGGQRPEGGDEHSTPSRPTKDPNQPTTQNTTIGNGSDEHSTPSPDPNHSIRQLHAQQRQQRVQQEETSPVNTERSQERNLITFTPSPANSVRQEGAVCEDRVQELNREGQPNATPMPQRVNTGKRSSHDTNPTGTTTSAKQEVPKTDQGMELNTERAPNGQAVTEVNEFLLEQQDSYLCLPIPQEHTAVRKCWRCGEEGHSKKECNRQVSCTFCQVYSHATQACKKYASFVRNSQGMSSKRTTPIQADARMQGLGRQGQRHVMNNYLRFQPPVVPPVIRPPVITQMAQAPPYPRQPLPQTLGKSLQDVRDDPNYISQETRGNKANNQPQEAPQEKAVYVKYSIPIGNEMPSATHPDVAPEVQPTQSQGQQQVPQRENSQMSQAQQRQLYAKIKQQQQQIKLMQQQNQ